MGMEEVALVHLEAGVLVVVGGARKGRKLPSFLEGAAFRGAMLEWGRANQRSWGCGEGAKRGCWWWPVGRSNALC